MDGGHQGLDVLGQHLARLAEEPLAQLVARPRRFRYPLAQPREVGLGELVVHVAQQLEPGEASEQQGESSELV